MRNYEDLEVWQKAHALTIQLYRITEGFPRAELFGLTSQIRRAAGSVEANLAEGCGRWGEAELARYVQISMGSASELQNHLRLARDLGFLSESNEAANRCSPNVERVLADIAKDEKDAEFCSSSGEQRRANGEERHRERRMAKSASPLGSIL